jgi:hypothetical protein
MKKNQHAQSEHFQEDICSSVVACNIIGIKIVLRLFQENKSYGVKTFALILCLHVGANHDIKSQTIRNIVLMRILCTPLFLLKE